MPERVNSSEALYEKMVGQDSDSMAFAVNRAKKEPGRTFSAEALDSLNDAVALFVKSRIAHHWTDHDAVGPTDLKVEVNVKVTVDGESIEVPDDLFPWYVIDGSARRAN